MGVNKKDCAENPDWVCTVISLIIMFLRITICCVLFTLAIHPLAFIWCYPSSLFTIHEGIVIASNSRKRRKTALIMCPLPYLHHNTQYPHNSARLTIRLSYTVQQQPVLSLSLFPILEGTFTSIHPFFCRTVSCSVEYTPSG